MKPTVIEKEMDKKEESWKKDWQLDLDDIIEDMESYTETDSNLSYQDELHKRIYEYGLDFIHKQIQKSYMEGCQQGWREHKNIVENAKRRQLKSK